MSGIGTLALTLPSAQQQEFALQKDSVSLGRAAINDVVVRAAKVSRAHARLECGAAGRTLQYQILPTYACAQGCPE